MEGLLGSEVGKGPYGLCPSKDVILSITENYQKVCIKGMASDLSFIVWRMN
jgi:hypothetical protein